MIKMTQQEALQLAKLITEQVDRADEGSDVEIEVLPHDMSVMVKSHGGWFRSGTYRSSFNGDPLKAAIAQSVEAGKKLRKELANK